ncbi:MAG TPA: cell division protein FtsW, partial [Alcaligenes faecalis]|nr:cell division protein FtsW [Alcaligenes faecalis]
MSLFAELTSGVNAVRPGRTALPAFDRPLLAATLMLTLFGLLMVYSASIALADGPRYESYGRYYFVIRHALFIVVGVVLAMFTATVPLR